jgi:hypothetical protein
MNTQDTFQKPQAVKTAVNLLWASIAVGLIMMLMDFSNVSAVAPPGFTLLVLVSALALIVFLIFRISAGKNWARITFLVMFVIVMTPTVPLMFSEFARSPFVAALSVTQVALQVYALFLLFTQPGTVWFQKTAQG